MLDDSMYFDIFRFLFERDGHRPLWAAARQGVIAVHELECGKRLSALLSAGGVC